MREQNLIDAPLLHSVLLVDITDGQYWRVSSIGTPVSFCGLSSGHLILSPDTNFTVLKQCNFLRWQSRFSGSNDFALSGSVNREDTPRAKQLIVDI